MNIYQGNINPCGSYCLVLMEPTVCLAPNDLSTKLKYKIKFKETTFQHLKQASSKYHFILAISPWSSSSAVVRARNFKVIADFGEITPWKLAKHKPQSDIEIQYILLSYILPSDMLWEVNHDFVSGDEIQKRFYLQYKPISLMKSFSFFKIKMAGWFSLLFNIFDF